MKHIKSILALTLVVVLLCGCGAGIKAEDLAGKWSMTAQSPQDEAAYLLDCIDLYAEERTFVDLNSLDYVVVAEFTADGSYSFAYDVEANKACVREFYEGVMTALYDNREALADLYQADTAPMTREEFNQFYADLYSVVSYEFLMNNFVDNAYNYETLAQPMETGTYKIVGDMLVCTITGETEAASMGCELNGDSLKLLYTDGEEVYSRVK